jgi:hypothetical protein
MVSPQEIEYPYLVINLLCGRNCSRSSILVF